MLCRNEALLSLVVVRRYFFSRIRTDPDPNLHSFNEICLKTKKVHIHIKFVYPLKFVFTMNLPYDCNMHLCRDNFI